jgi:perosamine synthetase
MKIKWSNPGHNGQEMEYLEQVIDTDYHSEGPLTKLLEEKLSKIVNAKHIILCTSATAALYLSIEADKKIRKYETGKVIMPNLNFVADMDAIYLSGLSTEIQDVNNLDYTLNAKSSIAMDKINKICIPVNLLGRQCPGWAACDTVIFDNAGCLGSKVQNGRVGCYSLQANKLISCGQGGFCATNDDEYAKVIRQLKDFGRVNKDDNDTIGFNFKFTDIQAAVVLGQLSNLTERKVKAVNQYLTYREELYKYGEFIDFDIDNGEVPLWIEFKCKSKDERDNLYEYLKSKDIETRKPWRCFIQDYECYPNSLEYQDKIIWLPNGFNLTEEAQSEVITEIKNFYHIS